MPFCPCRERKEEKEEIRTFVDGELWESCFCIWFSAVIVFNMRLRRPDVAKVNDLQCERAVRFADPEGET